MKKLFILLEEASSWCKIATGMHHTGFLLVLEMTCFFIDLQRFS
jgi:hypothetical protein